MSALAVATIVSALLAIAAAPWALGLPALAFVFKPLTTALVIAHAWPRGRATPALRRWVLGGLSLSLAGDVALLWPKQGFLPGLIAFLLAHLAYLAAFTRVQRLARPAWPFAAYALVAAAILAALWGGVPAALRLPVAAYVVCLVSMAAQAAAVWRGARGTDGEQPAGWLALGGALFVTSDALLAVERFMMPLPAASLWILASYWAAQWCIASWPGPEARRGGVRAAA
ncbi:MAG: lysoplasmalogenase [Betaproteobacteria bacterium]